jgi:hypothetical protein
LSINYCTLAGSSIDTFCGGRRAIVLTRLINELRPPVPQPTEQTRGGGPTPKFHQAQQVRRDHWEQPTINPPTELDRITVAVEFQDLKGSAFQDVDNRLDLVFVTNIEIEPVSVSVNISDLKIEH